MKSTTHVFGRILKKYKIPLNEIKDLNKKYEQAKSKLESYGSRLAGRLDSELQFTQILESTKSFSTITKCINDYINSSESFYLLPKGPHHLNILSCWINDMKEGEYNPPHTHHDLSGWSTVLYLKVPEFVNDTKDPHKFKDGNIGFISSNALGTTWMEPKLGDFYIFEAKHQHCVMPFKTKPPGGIRRSMSFNFVINEDTSS